MRVILSRKGFDSSAGGCPSPILPGGRLCSLPIPDDASSVPYGDIDFEGINLGDLVTGLTRDSQWHHRGAHLDPDLRIEALPRSPGWRPLLGQSGSAQGHLRNEDVGIGDLFLFFGSFRETQLMGGRYRFSPQSTPSHILWGWLQIGSIHQVVDLPEDIVRWAHYHPHLAYEPDLSNTLYLASDELRLDGAATGYPGAGLFKQWHPRLVLTEPGASRQTRWRLPLCFRLREGRKGLSFHRNASRWTYKEDHCLLDSAFRGQEFVFDTQGEDEMLRWIQALLAQS